MAKKAPLRRSIHTTRFPGEKAAYRAARDKLGDVSAVCWRRPREEVLAEIAKCELVCANCHAIRTYRRLRAAISGV